jgi:hypothetical protein
VVVLTAVVVLYIGHSAYRAGHQPTPTAAANAFLYAALHDRQPGTSAKYLCNPQVTHQVNGLIKKINDYAAQPGSAISYDWTVRATSQHGDQATVAADVTAQVTAAGNISTQPPQTWTLDMRNQGGWKVCRLVVPT